jgi:hypothetical protein
LTLVLKFVLILDIPVGPLMGLRELLVKPFMLPWRQAFFMRFIMNRTELVVGSCVLRIELLMIFFVNRLGHCRYGKTTKSDSAG